MSARNIHINKSERHLKESRSRDHHGRDHHDRDHHGRDHHGRDHHGGPHEVHKRRSHSTRRTSRDHSLERHKDPCFCGPNFYGSVLGPTADETILVGLQAFMRLCEECPHHEEVPAIEHHVQKEHAREKHHEHVAKEHLAEHNLAEENLSEENLAEEHLAEEHLAEDNLAEDNLAEEELAEEELAVEEPEEEPSASAIEDQSLEEEPAEEPEEEQAEEEEEKETIDTTITKESSEESQEHEIDNALGVAICCSPAPVESKTSCECKNEGRAPDPIKTSCCLHSPQIQPPCAQKIPSPTRPCQAVSYQICEIPPRPSDAQQCKCKTSDEVKVVVETSHHCCKSKRVQKSESRIPMPPRRPTNNVANICCCCVNVEHDATSCDRQSIMPVANSGSYPSHTCKTTSAPKCFPRKSFTRASICSTCRNSNYATTCSKGYSLSSNYPHQRCSCCDRQKEEPLSRYCECCATESSSGMDVLNFPQVSEECTCPSQMGDGVSVRYAITKITKFYSYTTFEVMKSTKKKPRFMPNSLEGVFVLKNTD